MEGIRAIGFTCGAFDLLHSGHILMFMECKQHCKHLKVGLQIDPSVDRETKNKPIQTMYERYVQLKAVEFVDEIIPYDTEESLIDILKSEIIDVRFLGEEYKGDIVEYTGKGLTKVHFTKRQHGFSSSSLRERVKNG